MGKQLDDWIETWGSRVYGGRVISDDDYFLALTNLQNIIDGEFSDLSPKFIADNDGMFGGIPQPT